MRKIKEFFSKNKVKIICILFIIIAVFVTAIIYISNKDARNWIDIYILKKNLSEKDMKSISLSIDKSNQIHIYSKNIAILNDKEITIYNSFAEKQASIKVNINTALFDSSNKYLAVAENQGHEFCLIFDKTYLWSGTLEGDILQVHVNQNGYVSVITTDATHKSILTLYNSEGKKIFTRYFASTRIIDASISKDNNFIAIAELDTSGTLIKSYVKIISVKNAIEDPDNTITYTYNLDDGNLISNIKYQNNGQIVFNFNNGIGEIKNENYTEILKIDNDAIPFIANDLKNEAVYIVEEKKGLFKSESNIHIVNTSNNTEKIYEIENATKDLYTKDSIIAINIGSDIYFINTNGWLMKKYTANQEITNVKFSENLAGIIYKDKVVIVDI